MPQLEIVVHFLASCALGAALIAQDPPTPDKPEPVTWPELSTKAAGQAKLAMRKLRGDDIEIAEAAEADLVALGAAVAPYLIQRLADRQPTAPETLARILDTIVEPRYAPLVAGAADSRATPVRSWAIGFLAVHHAQVHRPIFEKAQQDKDAEVAFRAALGLAGLGDIEALGPVFATCSKGFRDRAVMVGRALTPARSRPATEWLIAHMPRDDEGARITGLRLMRSLAPPEYAAVIVTFLDSDQHAVRKEAINALRAVVDGDAPLEDLSVFQAIDEAKKWKARIR